MDDEPGANGGDSNDHPLNWYARVSITDRICKT